jgi:hypothetical protein
VQVLHSPNALRWRVTPAPEPEEIVWNNLYIPAWQRALRRFIVGVLTFFLVVFYMVPIAFVASVTTLENLEKLLPFVKDIFKIGAVGAIVQVATLFEKLLFSFLFLKDFFLDLERDACWI